MTIMKLSLASFVFTLILLANGNNKLVLDDTSGWEKIYNHNKPQKCSHIGLLFANGIGVEQNNSKANVFLKRHAMAVSVMDAGTLAFRTRMV